MSILTDQEIERAETSIEGVLEDVLTRASRIDPRTYFEDQDHFIRWLREYQRFAVQFALMRVATDLTQLETETGTQASALMYASVRVAAMGAALRGDAGSAVRELVDEILSTQETERPMELKEKDFAVYMVNGAPAAPESAPDGYLPGIPIFVVMIDGARAKVEYDWEAKRGWLPLDSLKRVDDVHPDRGDTCHYVGELGAEWEVTGENRYRFGKYAKNIPAYTEMLCSGKRYEPILDGEETVGHEVSCVCDFEHDGYDLRVILPQSVVVKRVS